MRKRLEIRLAVAAVCLLLTLASEPFVTGLAVAQSESYPNTSWALGVVVPEGAGLLGGGEVHWEDVTNVTVELTLPNITLPDRNIYTVMSVMTSDGAVLQAAAGALPNMSGWLAFAWSIPNVESAAPVYQWILNSSEPQMAPGANITMSIFQASGLWSLRIVDADSGQRVQRPFPSGFTPTLKVGDQEVFALESYSRDESTFQSMGNLTLGALLLDGRRVISGVYAISQWDPNHTPVFIVGSSGANPPSFIEIGAGGGGSYFWEYTAGWEVAGPPPAAIVELIVVALFVASLVAVGLAIRSDRKQKENQRPLGPKESLNQAAAS